MFRTIAPLLLICVTVIVPGCERPDADGVVQVGDDDKAMNDAIATAQETYATFVSKWDGDGVEDCSIKIAMPTDSDSLEHIWFTPIKIEGSKITASCANDPMDISDLSYGDVRSFDQSDVTDWLIMQDDKCYGGYTIRVLAERDPDNAPPLEFADY